jgi:hypothetical protein
MPLRVKGDIIDGFEIVGRIGIGAVGVVYLANAPGKVKRQHQVAFKELRECAEREMQAHEIRFQTEGDAAELAAGPNVVGIYKRGKDRSYIAYRYFSGGTLERLIESSGRLKPMRAAKLVQTLAQAVYHVHAKGVIHRDIKPSNVLLDERGQPYLTDFGYAYIRDRMTNQSRVTKVISVVGTFAYMAPEQAVGKQEIPLPSNDVYSLGVVLYESLCGHRPIEGPSDVSILEKLTSDAAFKEMRRPHEKVEGLQLPSKLEDICMRALEKDPVKRHQTCMKLADDLRKFRKDVFYSRAKRLAGSFAVLALVVIGIRLYHLLKPANSNSLVQAPAKGPERVVEIGNIGDKRWEAKKDFWARRWEAKAGTEDGITWADDLIAMTHKGGGLALRLGKLGGRWRYVALVGPQVSGYGEYTLEFSCPTGLDPQTVFSFSIGHSKSRETDRLLTLNLSSEGDPGNEHNGRFIVSSPEVGISPKTRKFAAGEAMHLLCRILWLPNRVSASCRDQSKSNDSERLLAAWSTTTEGVLARRTPTDLPLYPRLTLDLHENRPLQRLTAQDIIVHSYNYVPLAIQDSGAGTSAWDVPVIDQTMFKVGKEPFSVGRFGKEVQPSKAYKAEDGTVYFTMTTGNGFIGFYVPAEKIPQLSLSATFTPAGTDEFEPLAEEDYKFIGKGFHTQDQTPPGVFLLTVAPKKQ